VDRDLEEEGEAVEDARRDAARGDRADLDAVDAVDDADRVGARDVLRKELGAAGVLVEELEAEGIGAAEGVAGGVAELALIVEVLGDARGGGDRKAQGPAGEEQEGRK